MKTFLVDSLSVRLFESGSLTIDTSWRAPNVQSTYWRLYLNDRDGAGLILGGQLYPLRGGRLYFVPPGVKFSCTNSTQLTHFYIHFDLLGLPKTAMRALFSQPIRLEHAGFIEEEARSTSRALRDTPFRDIIMHCRLEALICEGLARYLEQIPEESYQELERMTNATAPIQPALEAIERELATPLRNPDLAALCSLSTDHFTRVFHQCMNQTPAQYVQERRVMQAAQRLLYTNASIDAIAADSGFANRYYFTRVFTRHIGIGPAAYRNLSRSTPSGRRKWRE
ncbi:MAG: AraC family transcriptional regulator [Capsulimonadaceae bacterium]|nr:AraC family transcriptional regulator [Capsulimonadaceae bacterium]